MMHGAQFIALLFLVKCAVAANKSACGCTRQFQPLCGTNGITYDNECMIRCEKTPIDIAYKGVCCPELECTFNVAPLCDSDGDTHLNECIFELARCLRMRIQGKIIRIAERGDCKEPELCRFDCTRDVVGPVCDNFMRTHNSYCDFRKMNCEIALEGKHDQATIEYFGECEVSNTEPVEILEQVDAVAIELHMWSNQTVVEEQLTDDHNLTEVEKALNLFIPDLRRLEGVPIENSKESEENKKNEAAIEQLLPFNGEEQHNANFNDISSLNDVDVADFVESRNSQKTSRRVAHSPVIATLDTTTLHSKEVTITRDSSHKIKTITEFAFATEEEPTSVEGSGLDTEVEIPTATTETPCSAVMCTKEWDPVCDSRNVTHRNPCLFEFHACTNYRQTGDAVVIGRYGECDSKREACAFCGEKIDDGEPLCDNHNRTHKSLCEFSRWNCESANLGRELGVLVHTGECHPRSLGFSLEEENCPSVCTRDFKPVCDVYGKTHPNLCSYQRANCLARKNGEPWAAHSLFSLFACEDSDQATEELFKAEAAAPSQEPPPDTSFSIDSGHSAMKDTKIICPKPDCSRQGQPVCDNKGGVHENTCVFNWARCISAQHGIVLTLLPEEQCALAGCGLKCGHEEDPICGGDFRTYKNLCHYRRARCENPSLDQLFIGACSLCFDKPCEELSADAPDDKFICDHNSVTRSQCEFRMLKCVLERNFGYSLELLYNGRCCPHKSSCPKKKSPVCGTDGVTYANDCVLHAASCAYSKATPTKIITIAHSGKCTVTRSLEGQPAVSGERSAEVNAKLTVDEIAVERHVKIIQRSSKIPVQSNCSECPEDMDPVCASNGKTYGNVCLLKRDACLHKHSLAISYKGTCCIAQCAPNFSPVCDSHGKTHRNLCKFGLHRCESMKKETRVPSIAQFDVCKSNETACERCPMKYDPVCGSNGETYMSECELSRANCLVEHKVLDDSIVTLHYNGECCSPLSSCNSALFSPVCDSEGKTHSNECILSHYSCVQRRQHSKNITRAYRGACCNQPCPEEYNAVCDGESTHSNMCHFRVAQCLSERRGQVMAVAYAGECCVLEKGPCAHSGPLCDSDGETHVNRCRFEQKKCRLSRNKLKEPRVVHAGECCVIEKCAKDEQPVCDNKGKTHASLCHLQNTKCINDKVHPGQEIEFDYAGPCCDSDCPNESDAVCDQHANVYKNQCLFKLRACETSRRTDSSLLQTPCPTRRTRHLEIPGEPITVQ